MFLQKKQYGAHSQSTAFSIIIIPRISYFCVFKSLSALPAAPQLDRKSMEARTERLDMMSMAVTLISVSPNCMVALISLRSGSPPPAAPPTAPGNGNGSGRSKVIVPHFLTPGSEMYVTSSVTLQ